MNEYHLPMDYLENLPAWQFYVYMDLLRDYVDNKILEAKTARR